MLDIGKFLIGIGLAIACIGFLFWIGSKGGIPFGRLSGDMSWKKERFFVFFPLAGSLIMSFLLTLLLNLAFWLFRK